MVEVESILYRRKEPGLCLRRAGVECLVGFPSVTEITNDLTWIFSRLPLWKRQNFRRAAELLYLSSVRKWRKTYTFKLSIIVHLTLSQFSYLMYFRLVYAYGLWFKKFLNPHLKIVFPSVNIYYSYRILIKTIRLDIHFLCKLKRGLLISRCSCMVTCIDHLIAYFS